MSDVELQDYSYLRWHNSGAKPKLGLAPEGSIQVDASAFSAFLLLGFFPSETTFYTSLSIFAVLAGLEYLGYTLPVAAKKLRGFIAGKRRGTTDIKLRRRRLAYG
ncbi:hypothetical protein A3709_19580 [Halioglobus sp. HI00S01]|uniref:IcmT/TraK family protein n=1 Tax=Halioglobus sp. HI00S01 TaxID=1822214 RepID=UPI0007C2B974|nr:IcmT/TraK family protein [Halioglobus sp. HI00S01]KZX57827.1 hypothetical protein A3709_19580 [Halioglobus sp. HI00S01]